MREIPNAIKALTAPTLYVDTQGVLQDPWSQQPLPGTDDKVILRMLTPFLARGVRVGSKEGQMDDFIADLTAYFSAQLR